MLGSDAVGARGARSEIRATREAFRGLLRRLGAARRSQIGTENLRVTFVHG